MQEASKKCEQLVQGSSQRRYRRQRESLAAIRAATAAKNATGSLEDIAKAYQQEYQKGWRQENPSYHAEYLRKYYRTPKGREILQRADAKQKEKRKRFLIELKSAPCKDCQQSFPPEAMDFDHRDPATKSFSIATFGRRVAKSVLLAEIAKCDLVCSNCHRVRTVRRRTPIDNPSSDAK